MYRKQKIGFLWNTKKTRKFLLCCKDFGRAEYQFF